MGLDLRTVAFVCAIISLLLAIVLRIASTRFPAKWRPALVDWSRALFVLPVGWLLLGLRGAMPMPAGILATNLTLFLGFALLAVASSRFAGRRPPFGLLWLLGVLYVANNLAFGYFQESFTARTLLGSPLIALLFWLTARPLLGAFGRDGLVSHRITAAVFIVGIALMAVRVSWEVVPAWRTSDALDDTAMQMLVLFYLPIAPLIATFGFLLMCADRANAELEQLATVDPLTGAWNRRALLEQCERSLALDRRQRRPSSLLLVDADHFKHVNDTYGHEAGDAVLRELVRRMHEVLRSEDIVGRLGGEEFVALLPGTAEAGACEVAERMRAAMQAENFFCRGEEIPLTISIGVGERETGEADIAALVQRADRAMYAAKRAGRNRVVAASTLRDAIEAS